MKNVLTLLLELVFLGAPIPTDQISPH